MTEHEYIEKIAQALSQTFGDTITEAEVREMLRNQDETADSYWSGLQEANQTAAEYEKGTQAKPDKEKDPVAYSQWLKHTQQPGYGDKIEG